MDSDETHGARQRPLPFAIHPIFQGESAQYIYGSKAESFVPSRFRVCLGIYFAGHNPLSQADDPRVGPEGLLPDVELLTFMSKFLRACLRFGSSSSKDELVAVGSTDYRYDLRFTRQRNSVLIRLLRTSSVFRRAKVLAEVSESLQSLLVLCIAHAGLLRYGVEFVNSGILKDRSFQSIEHDADALKKIFEDLWPTTPWWEI